jgi:cytoskeletal protein RodZ
MFADDKVRRRRVLRRVKAAASIVVALVAGTFLACRRDEPPSTSGPDHEPTVDLDTPGTASAQSSAQPSTSATATASAGAGGQAPAATPPAPSAKPTVDKNQHKKGMPVPDNLLE